MASDVGAILAAATAGGGAKVVDITLRVRADSGNGAVAKQLADQVNDAVRKAYRDIETVTQRLVASANQSAQSIGDAMSKSLERVSAKHTEVSARMVAENKAVSEAYKKRVAEAERDSRRQAAIEATLTKQAEESAIASLDRVHEHRRKKAAERKQEELNTGLKQLGEVASEAGGLIKDVALAIAPKEAAEQLARGLEKFDHIFGIFEHGLKVFAGINEALVTMKKYAAAAAAEQRLLAAAQAGSGPGRGFGSGAMVVGEGALASVGSTATIAGVGALTVGAGVAVHDILAKLTGKYETLTGVVDDWIATTKRSAELEKTIERQQRARGWERERLKELAEGTQKSFEGRARIEEAEGRQRAASRYASRTADYASLAFADTIGIGTKSELELRVRAEQSAQREAEQREYEQQRAAALGRFFEAHRQVSQTVQENKKRAELAKKYGIGPLKLGPFQGMPTPEQREAHQKEVDEAEAGVVHEGWGHAFKQLWFGAGSVRMSLERAKTEQELAKTMNLSPMGQTPEGVENAKRVLRMANNSPKEIDPYIQNKLEQEGIDPHSSVMGLSEPYKADLAKQQLLEAEQIKQAQHLFDLTQKRHDALLSELATMRQQIQASKERVAFAKEGVRVAQEQVNARKAEIAFSMNRSDQRSAAGILTELEQGKNLSLDKLLFLKQHGLTGGKAGLKINELGAKYMDPTLAAIGKKLGMFGEDELGKKEKELADATGNLKGEFERFGKTLRETLGNIVVLSFAGMVGGHATREHGRTESQAGGYPDPNERPGKSKAALELERSADRIVAAIDEWQQLDIESFKRIEKKVGGALQQLKDAHK